MLKVTVAEVQRDIIKQLGIDLAGQLGSGRSVLDFNNDQSVPGPGQPLVGDPHHHRHLGNSHHGHAARDGARRRHPHARRAEPDRDLGRERHTSSPAANSRSRVGYTCDRGNTRNLPIPIQFKKFGVELELHADRAGGRPHQPQGHDRSVRAFHRQQLTLDAVDRHRAHSDHSLDPDPARRDHGRNSLRRLARDGGHDPGADQAADQRHFPA